LNELTDCDRVKAPDVAAGGTVLRAIELPAEMGTSQSPGSTMVVAATVMVAKTTVTE
jgi:hypothetical protein